MNKKLKLLTTLLACVSLTFNLIGCDLSSTIDKSTDGKNQSEIIEHEHNYTQEAAEEKYIKAEATCESPAIYYKSCECGAAGEETFAFGGLAGHNMVDDICSVCQKSISYGLYYELLYDGLSGNVVGYVVKGVGACTDTDIIIPATHNDLPVRAIFEKAFYHTAVKSIDIPDSVLSIGKWAFWQCANLEQVKIGAGVTYIGVSTFRECTKLTCIDIPNNVKKLDDWIFSYCSNLSSVTIGEGTTYIGEGAFLACKKLSNITIDKNNTVYKSIDGNLYTKDGTTLIQYAAGKTTTSFTLPDNVTIVNTDAFWNCDNLTSVEIPDSVTSIGDSVFYGCDSLTSITIPDSVMSIGDEAFFGCSNLTSITIPDGVTSIGDSAFSNCGSLTSITIPDGVTNIGNWAFADCGSLTSISFNGTVKEWKAVKKGSYWSGHVPATVVVCTDGEVEI